MEWTSSGSQLFKAVSSLVGFALDHCYCHHKVIYTSPLPEIFNPTHPSTHNTTLLYPSEMTFFVQEWGKWLDHDMLLTI